MLSKMSSISIAKKITLLFTSIFMLAVFILTLSIFMNASSFFARTMQAFVEDEINEVRVFILSGNPITEASLQNNQRSNYVDILVTNTKTGKVVSNRAQINEQGVYYVPDSVDETKGVFRFATFEKSASPMWIEESAGYLTRDIYVEYEDAVYRITGLIHQQIERKYMGSLTSMLFLLNGGGLVMAVMAASFIASRILKPVEKIRQTAERISVEDLSRRIDITGPDDEIKELAITFNAMFDRLEAEFKKQAQFVSDASHELRTPVSVIQGYANLISRWGKDDPAVLDEAIESIRAETEHMSVLIKKLLFLAKDKQNAKLMLKEKMSLCDMTEEIAREIEVMETGHRVFVETCEPFEITADINLMKQLLWTILDNSIKYTPKEGSITISVTKDNQYAYVSVQDTGIGIDREELPYIFGRFYRVDKSRNKSIEGTGLGLSIAEWIAKQHKAEIQVESKEGEGTKMTIKIPL